MFKKLSAQLQVSILAICSLVTTITVVLIIIFLFTQGFSFFTKKPLEQGSLIVVNASNPLQTISPAVCKKVFDQEIDNWKSLNGNDAPIELFSVDDNA